MVSNPTDVLAARRGDPDAFARLVQDHASAVCAVTTAILGDPRAGEEVGQEAFVCAWEGLGKLRDPERFAWWLRGIARNRAREALRSRLQRREVGAALDRVADPAPDPGERIDGERREAALWTALDDLDEGHREVLVLFYREGRSVSQVARQLELTEPTVRKRLSRARDRLRDGVEARLEHHLAHTGPRAAAFVAAVLAAVALVPLPAHAATGSTWPTLAARIGIGAAAAVTALVIGTSATWSQLRRQLPEIAPPPVAADRVLGDVVPPLAPAPPRPVDDEVHDEVPEEVPDHVVHAFLAAEDARFFEHGAVDVRAIGRATLRTLSGGARDGGSTLTQQLAKRMLTEQMPEPTLRRKVSEVVLAVELERRLTKEEILRRYLDGVYLGAGAYGLDEAGWAYFDKPVGALTLAEGAVLAGIPAHPRGNGPFDDPAGAERRRAQVLDQMQAHGWASASEVADALATALPVRR
jgi:RNA polymerase sigma factor (sigma-70 family)